jgi:hypothetical protein
MRMLDLFCGRFGWGKAFAARGWEVVGIDLVEPPEIPEGCTFFKSDILKITADSPFFRWDDGTDYFDFICASSPCEKFSLFGMRNFHKSPPYPEMGITLFNHTRALCEQLGVLYIMENVRSAQDFVGKAVDHCGPFYLWGNSVPPILPQGISKGIKVGTGHATHGMTAEQKKEYRKLHAWTQAGSKSKARREMTAVAATIPPELANCVCDYAERLLEQRKTA